MKEALTNIVEGEVFVDAKTMETYSTDTSLFHVTPSAVVFPKNIADLKALIRYATEEAECGNRVSITARSAGTDMTGGPLNQGIILDFTKYFNHILQVTDSEATVEPGVYFRDFDKETQKKNRILPSYPASRELCTVGGMTANNSGGEKSLTYGKTEKYVESLQVVLSDGNEYTISPLTISELEKKMELDTFEGTFYRKMHALVVEHETILNAAKPDVSKNSSGYALWNIFDKDNQVFDLTQLFVGSQGTLGLITQITFKLVRPKKHSRLLVIFLKDMSILGKLVNDVVSCAPESFESYDDHTFHVAMRLFPQIVKRLGGNIFKLGIQFIPEFWAVVTGGVPKLVLLAEFTGDSDKEALSQAKRAKEALAQYNLKTRITRNASEAEKYWTVRRESFNLLRQKVKDTRTAPFIDDLVVRPQVLPEFLPELYKILDEYSLTYTIAGHMGDGNFHIIPLMDLTKPESKKIIHELNEHVYKLVWKYHGSNTGEHNDGILRSPYLGKMYGDDVYHLFERTKRIFDPLNIFNPGKKVNSDLRYAEMHIDTRSTS